MTDFQKTLYVADAICDCIPLVSTVTNVSEVLYKLAHRVDAVSPVTPGRATSLKIHVLHKDLLGCFVGAIPIFGNVVRFIQFTVHALMGFKIFDPLDAAIVRDNQELLHLCLGNRPLTPAEADAKLHTASVSSSPETVRKILGHSDGFSPGALIRGLNPLHQADASTAAKATAILDRWNFLGRQLTRESLSIPAAVSAARLFLAQDYSALTSRILAILPKNSLSLAQAQPFLDSYDAFDLAPSPSAAADPHSSLLSKLTGEAASQLAASPDTPLPTLQRLLALRKDLDGDLLIQNLFPPQGSAPLEKAHKARDILAYLGAQPTFTAAPLHAIRALFRLMEAEEFFRVKELMHLLPPTFHFQEIEDHIRRFRHLGKFESKLRSLWDSRFTIFRPFQTKS